MKKVYLKLALISVTVVPICAQGPVAPPVAPHITRGPAGIPAAPALAVDNFERAMSVDPGLNLTLCVTQGNVKINGWNRGELRVFVQDGSKFGFKVLETSPKTQAPVWVSITGVENRNKRTGPTECIAGGEIEIDMPVNATLKFTGQETSTTVDTLRKVNVKTIGGDISLRNIAEGITASTYEGGVTVERSSGAMNLESTTGNIVVFEASPSEIGDGFQAKTSGGAISLQNLSYRQVDVNSISGSVAFSGEIRNNGNYSLTTSKGSIRLVLPLDTACNVLATYGYGTFNSEIPFKLQTENLTGGDVKNVVGTLGAGGSATVKLITNNGTIGIKKL